MHLIILTVYERRILGVCEFVMVQKKLFNDCILLNYNLLSFLNMLSHRERGMLEMPPNSDTYPNGKKDTIMCWPLFLLANKVFNLGPDICLLNCLYVTFWRYVLSLHFLFNYGSSGNVLLWHLKIGPEFSQT